MNERRAARLFIMDEEVRVLLFQVDDNEIFLHPTEPHVTPYWILPGGGLEEGESYEQAAQRELREETGLDAPVGPCVGTQDVVLLIRGVPTRCLERFYLVRAGTQQVDVDGLFGVERELFRSYKWWVPDEMAASGETFLPPGLVALSHDLVAGKIPPDPVKLYD